MYLGSTFVSPDEHVRQSTRFTQTVDVSTADRPRREQFDAFRSTYQGVLDILPVASEPEFFVARQKVWNLGRMAFMRTELPGKDYPHRQKHLKKCALDHWYINLPFTSPKNGLSHDKKIARPEVHCLGMSFDTMIDHDGMLTLFIPHDLFNSTSGFHAMLDVTLDGGLGKLLADYLFVLNRSLDDLRLPEIPYVFEATRSLVAVCMAASHDRTTEAQAPIDATLLARARRLIDGKLADRELTSDMVCAALGVSRSRLYRLFAPLGGIASYIRKQRLLRTRDALSDIADCRSISRIAEQWGFSDASAYSRTFRHEFGISPKEARDIGWASDGFVVARENHDKIDGPQTLFQLLRTVSGG